MAAYALSSMRLVPWPTKSWPLSAGRKTQNKGDWLTFTCRVTLHEHLDAACHDAPAAVAYALQPQETIPVTL